MPSRRVPLSCSRRGAGSAAKASVGSRWRDRESVRTATACAFMIGIPSFACVGRRLGSGDGVCRDRFESPVEQCRGVEFLLGGFARHEIYGVLLERDDRSEEHTSELQSLMRISYAVFCLQKKKHHNSKPHISNTLTNK